MDAKERNHDPHPKRNPHLFTTGITRLSDAGGVVERGVMDDYYGMTHTEWLVSTPEKRKARAKWYKTYCSWCGRKHTKCSGEKKCHGKKMRESETAEYNKQRKVEREEESKLSKRKLYFCTSCGEDYWGPGRCPECEALPAGMKEQEIEREMEEKANR
jgi:hypothetical protein